jgi:hypothetical protein
MTEATHFSNLLLPELEAEFKRTRRILSAVPDGHGDFKPHEKSMSLAKLAGHVAELPGFIQIILTHPDLDMALPGNPRKPVVLETTAQVVAEFDQRAGAAIATLKETSNQTFEQPWSLSRGELKIFSVPRAGRESHHPPPRPAGLLHPRAQPAAARNLRPLSRRNVTASPTRAACGGRQITCR